MSYKAAHESFVSGGEGSTHFHIACTFIAMILPVYLRDVLYILFPSKLPGKESPVSRHILDFLLTVIPLMVVTTVANEVSLQWLMLESFLITLFCSIYTKNTDDKTSSGSTEEIPMGNRRPFITYSRAYVSLFTAFSILAVDFKIFPRYFAKAETYGTGMMDAGVGSFMVSNAIVSPEARGIVSSENGVTSILKSVKSSIPLMVIGALRVVAVKATDYQEHVTEYGVHWNFFITLAVVKVLVTVMFCIVPRKFWNLASVGVIAVYQNSLTFDGLKDYIIKGSDGQGGRQGFLDANREGLYSCAGYLSLYVMGVNLGKLIMKQRNKASDWTKLCIHLAIVTAGTWILLYCSEKYVEPVSRRFANLSYMLWILALNSLFLLVMLIFDIVVTCLHHDNTDHKKQESQDDKQESLPEDVYDTSALLYATNYNGLAYFLLANVLTGLVNMTVRTIYQPTLVAIAILTTYMFGLHTITSYLYHKKISLKFW